MLFNTEAILTSTKPLCNAYKEKHLKSRSRLLQFALYKKYFDFLHDKMRQSLIDNSEFDKLEIHKWALWVLRHAWNAWLSPSLQNCLHVTMDRVKIEDCKETVTCTLWWNHQNLHAVIWKVLVNQENQKPSGFKFKFPLQDPIYVRYHLLLPVFTVPES